MDFIRRMISGLLPMAAFEVRLRVLESVDLCRLMVEKAFPSW